MTALATVPAHQLQAVPFHAHEVLAARIGNEIRVPMKRFCSTIGLPWEPQRKRIERTEMLARGASIMEVPSAGGTQEQTALPVRLLAPFLMGVSTRRLAPELAARVILFQEECADVLYRHFFSAAAAPVPVAARAIAPPWQELEGARRSAPALISTISAERRPAVRRFYHELLRQDADRLGLDAPKLEQLGRDATSADAQIERLVAGLQLLTARRAKWNHFGRRGCNGRMAIVLPELERAFRQHDIDIAIDDELRDALRAGNRHYQVTEAVMPSAIRRQNVFATILAPWPIGDREGE